MKTKPSPERVPFRRGLWEENLLQWLGQQSSPFVPPLGSDNQWLRFAVRVLAELSQLSGTHNLTFEVGTPGGASTTLRVQAAPLMTELSAGTSEARLRKGEAQLLDQLKRSLGHSSRAATLRHALYACQQAVDSVSRGDKIWVERNGNLHILRSLNDIAANMEVASTGSVALLGGDMTPALAAPRKATTSEAAVLFLVTALTSKEHNEVARGEPAIYLEDDNALLDRMGADTFCFETEVPGSTSKVRCIFERGGPRRVELVHADAEPNRVSDVTAQHVELVCPQPPGRETGLDELRRSRSSA